MILELENFENILEDTLEGCLILYKDDKVNLRVHSLSERNYSEIHT
jgi:hypothetical protein